MPVLIATVALLGLAVGSFLNVVIHRVPRGESLLHPGSHCPTCTHAIRARHNVPVFSWLILRGKCADCRTPISARYPVVEALTAALFVATAVEAARLHLLAALPAYLFFVSVGIALAAIDIDVMRLPNAIVYPTYLVLAVLLGGASLVEGSPAPIVRSVIAGTALFGFFLVLALAYPQGMGLGDVKLAGVVGAVLGFVSYPAVVVGAFAAFVVGAVVGSAALLARRGGRKSALPFGPAMIAGTLIAFFGSAPIVAAYSHFVRPA